MGVRPYGSTTAVAMTLNYTIGTGCFGLPFAFASAGLGLTSIFMLLGFLGSIVTMNYTIEAMARAEGITAEQSGCGLMGMPQHKLTYRKIGFSVIGQVFAGSKGYALVNIMLIIYFTATLWSYACILASSTASIYFTYVVGGSCDVYSPSASTGCVDAYYISMAIFAVIALAMVLKDLGDQAMIQKILSGYRIVALSVMLITMAVKLSVDGSDSITARLKARGSWAFNVTKFSSGFGPTILALICHLNMPDALQPLHKDHKKHARRITFSAITISGVLYLMLGILGALAFDDVKPLASLMWSDFSGCGNGWTPCPSGHSTWIGHIVHFVVLFFPIVNVISTYPMKGITVGCNILTSLPKSMTTSLGPIATHRVSRLIGAVPPLILATLFKKLDAIFTFAGYLGFILGLIIPCWFQVVGIQYCRRVYGCVEAAMTPFSSPLISSLYFSWIFLVMTFIVTLVAILALFVAF